MEFLIFMALQHVASCALLHVVSDRLGLYYCYWGIRCPVHALDFLLTVTICQGMRSSHRIAVDVSVTIRFVLPKEGRLKRFVFYRFV